METQQHADKDLPQNWTHEQFNVWRRTEYSGWKKSGAAAAASGASAGHSNSSSTGPTTSAGDDRTKLNDFNKTSKSEKDYEILKNDKYSLDGKRNLKEKHKYTSINDCLNQNTMIRKHIDSH